MRIAIVGQGVIGSSTALAILEKYPGYSVTLFGDKPFEKTCSFGPAGLFRLDRYDDRELAKLTFERFSYLDKNFNGNDTGIKLLSGHIQSDNHDLLKTQEKNYADIVYNFRWLDQREKDSLFPNPSRYCIHFTSYGSEGRRYVPWLRNQCESKGAKYVTRSLESLKTLMNDDNYDVIINSAGLSAGKLAGDDNTMVPVRGVGFLIDAPWHKHFNYIDTSTITIPMTDYVFMGTTKQHNRDDLEITDEDRKDIWDRYLKLQSNFKNVKVIGEWSGIRPHRPTLRLEKKLVKRNDGKECLLIHNYGHGGNGFTIGWGCALKIVQFIDEYGSTIKSKL